MRQHHYAIFAALAVTHNYDVAVKVDIFDSQAQALNQSCDERSDLGRGTQSEILVVQRALDRHCV